MNDDEIIINYDDLLIEYAKTGNLDGIKLLVENGIEMNEQNGFALYIALQNKHPEIYYFLIENNADISAKNYIILHHLAWCNYVIDLKYIFKKYDLDESLIFVLCQYYGRNLKLTYDRSLIEIIDVLLWSIKLNLDLVFLDYFNGKEEYEIYNYLFNNKIGNHFNIFLKEKDYLKNKYVTLKTICLQ